jgi:catechol 2,3-dioxygenase-like lactoylglutathione lyase family enzyme
VTSRRTLTGVHHVRLPVSDLARSFAFWGEVLGYERDFDFPGPDGPLGWALKHPLGGPRVVLWRDAERAAVSAGFSWFSLGLPSSRDVVSLAEDLDRRGISHGGVQDAMVEVKLPSVVDPDGHLIGFYVLPDGPTT